MGVRALVACFLLLPPAQAIAAEVPFQPRWRQPFEGASGIEARIADLIQEVRRQAGLVPFYLDESLRQAARQHSLEMHRERYMAHESPHAEWRTPVQRAYLAGYLDAFVGENVGQVYHSAGATEAQYAREFVAGWMNSPPHRRNILNPAYNTLGIGVCGDGRHYYATQMFGAPVFEFRRVRLSEEKVTLCRWRVRYRTPAKRLGLWVNGEFTKEVVVEKGEATLTYDLPGDSGTYRLEVGADQVVTGEFLVNTAADAAEPFRLVRAGRRAELLNDDSERMTTVAYCLRGEARCLIPASVARLRVGDETRSRYPLRPGEFFAFSVCLPRNSGIHHIGFFPDTIVKYHFFVDTGKPLAEAFLPRRTDM